ncbi:MAG: hypothetical protein II699_05245 [Lachnospiraceae bacterium]|nr:hypothetical protein [Lachnospiraceae bacterium]
MFKKYQRIIAMVLTLALLAGISLQNSLITNATLTLGSADASASASNNASANPSSDASTNASANASGEATTEAATTAIEATTEASAESQSDTKTMSDGIGYAMLDGIDYDFDFSKFKTYYVPFKFEQTGYLTVKRVDASSDAVVSVTLLPANDYANQTASTDATLKAEESSDQIAVQAGSYFLKLESDKPVTVTIGAYLASGLFFYNGSNKLELGTHTASQAFYYEYIATGTGYFTVENMTKSKVSVALCNKDKAAVTKAVTLAAYSKTNHKRKKTIAGFGLLKGESYVIKVTAAKTVKSVTLKGALASYPTVGGVNLGEASFALAKKKTYKATSAALSSPSFYTFKKTSKKKIQIIFNTKGLKNQGTLDVRLYYLETKGDKKGEILPVKIKKKHFGFTQKAGYKKTMKLPANWPNRTYYLKVSNSNKSTGCYTIQYK